MIETGRLLQRHGEEFQWPGNARGVDKVLAHIDKEAHASDTEAAGAIEALLKRVGAHREAATRGGRSIRTKRADTDQVPRLVRDFKESSKLWG